MADKKLDFIVIPNKVMYCKNLTANAKLLMGVIIDLCNSKGNCWASNQYLAEILDTHFMTISKWIHFLEKNGFIKCNVKKDNKRKIYIAQSLSKSLELYAKLLIDYKSNSLHIQTQQEQLSDAALANKDDFDIKERKWTDKDGKKNKRISIDYGEEIEPQ
jgi:DNA-binding PadR family transcriptional regulator